MSAPTPKPGILVIPPYVPGKAKAPGFAAPIKLSANENALGCSPAAQRAYREAQADLHLYPDPNVTELRAALAARHAIEPSRIVFGTGSDEIFSMVCQAYLEPGDNIVQPVHGFAAWAIAARAAGAIVKSSPERDYTADVDALLADVDERTRIVFIANPANPSGTCVPFAEIVRLHAGLRPNVLLLLDSAYVDFARAMLHPDEDLDLARRNENVIVTRTFSKLHGLAALRIGWGYAAQPIVDALGRIRLPFNVSRPAHAAAIAALEDEDFVERSIAHTEAGRASLARDLARLGLEPVPSASNFVTARFPPGARLTAAEAEKRLAERGILVRWLGNYAMPDCIRVTIGAEAHMARLLAELETLLL